MKIVEYKIVDVKSVNTLIEKGWQPWGSPLVNGNFNRAGISQAMVRYEEERIDKDE